MPKAMSDAEVELAIVRWHEVTEETRQLRDNGDKRAGYSGHPLVEEGHAIQTRLADEFGQRHGWIRADSSFSIETLAARKPHGGYGGRQTAFGDYRDLFDHIYYYREPTAPYRAAAVAAHLYRHRAGTADAARYPHMVLSEQQLGEVIRLVVDLGPVLSWPMDYPSWWNPGMTSLVLYTPAAGIQR